MKHKPLIERICKSCGKKFLIWPSIAKLGRGTYCSLKCFGKSITQRISKICPICKQVFTTHPCKVRDNKGKYCSKKCMYIGITKKFSKPCEVCGKDFIVKMGDHKRGRKFCSRKCFGIGTGGSNCHFWEGGKTKASIIFRHSSGYKKWRNRVLERDNYTCQKCRTVATSGDGIYLHVHHVKSVSEYPELILDINNGTTLCLSCHEQEHDRKFTKWRRHFENK